MRITKPIASGRDAKPYGWIVAEKGVVVGRYCIDGERVLVGIWSGTWVFNAKDNWRKSVRNIVTTDA